MLNILLCIMVIMPMGFCLSTINDLDSHLLLNVNSSNKHPRSLISEASVPVLSHYLRSSPAFSPNIRELSAKYYTENGYAYSQARDPYITVLDSNRRIPTYQQFDDDTHNRKYPAYEDHSAMQSVPEHDVLPLKKHDYVDDQNYGGWDTFPGGTNFGTGSGLVHIGQAVKKGKEAKALFLLMTPLILLAVFGPILATQAMIPWLANGGLSSVTTLASGGKRKKRTLRDPRQMAELEKRLQLFLAIQDFIAKTGSTDFAEEMGEAFMNCQKYTERRNKCLERIACEYTDETSAMDPAERRIAKMVLQNVMANPMIPASIKGRLSKGSTFGKNQKGRCRNYWCEAIDGPKRAVNHS